MTFATDAPEILLRVSLHAIAMHLIPVHWTPTVDPEQRLLLKTVELFYYPFVAALHILIETNTQQMHKSQDI